MSATKHVIRLLSTCPNRECLSENPDEDIFYNSDDAPEIRAETDELISIDYLFGCSACGTEWVVKFFLIPHHAVSDITSRAVIEIA